MGERPCPQCSALVVWIAPWGLYEVEGKQGKHRCETAGVEIPLQLECWRCLSLFELYEDGRRLNLNGEPHECGEQAPVLAPAAGLPAGRDPIPATARRRGVTHQPEKAVAPRRPVPRVDL